MHSEIAARPPTTGPAPFLELARNLGLFLCAMETIAVLRQTSFQPTSSLAELSAFGDDFSSDFCLLTRTRQSWSFHPSARILGQNKGNLAHPTRFERVTFAFGGQWTRN